MKLILFFSMIISFGIYLYGGEQTYTMDKAKQLSLEKNIPILIDFMTDW